MSRFKFGVEKTSVVPKSIHQKKEIIEGSDPSTPSTLGSGSCSQCNCPGFVGGSGVYSCQRSGCGHHYDQHW